MITPQLSSEEILHQHDILKLLQDNLTFVKNATYFTPVQIEEGTGYELPATDSIYVNINDRKVAFTLQLEYDKTVILLENLKRRQFILIDKEQGNACTITIEGSSVYKESLLIREASELNNEARKERLANRISIANVVIPILAFLLPLLWAYFFQIEPLQKERDNLKDSVKELTLKNQQLLKLRDQQKKLKR